MRFVLAVVLVAEGLTGAAASASYGALVLAGCLVAARLICRFDTPPVGV